MVCMLIVSPVEEDFTINIDHRCKETTFDSILVAPRTSIPSLGVNIIQIDVVIAHVLKITIASIVDQKVFLIADQRSTL